MEQADRLRTPEEQIDASFPALTAALQSDLLERVREMSPGFFERLIVDLLIAMGYGGGRAEMGQAIGRVGDGGIDGMIKEDALGLDIVYVQAKRYAAATRSGVPTYRALPAVWTASGRPKASSLAPPPSARGRATMSGVSASASF